jgi:hypothetical protein
VVGTALLAKSKKPNTTCTLETDERYLRAWHEAALGRPMALPVEADAIRLFLVHHAGAMPKAVRAPPVAAGVLRLKRGRGHKAPC